MFPRKLTKAYPEFIFVEKILITDRILYESKKPRRIWWYYSQWQDSYKVMQSSFENEIQFFVAFQSLKKIFGKLTQSLTMCWCLMILRPKQQIVLSFAFCLPKGGIQMLVWYCCYKICFQRENLTRTSAGMLSTWLFSKVLAIENKSVSLRNECLTKIARDSCQLIFKKRKERLVLSSLTIAQTRRVISKYWVTFSAIAVDIRLLTAPQNRSKQSKRPVTRKTFPAKIDQQQNRLL